MLTDYKAVAKAFVHLLAISAIWYILEFMEFGTLQWDRACDNIIGFIFFLYYGERTINTMYILVNS